MITTAKTFLIGLTVLAVGGFSSGCQKKPTVEQGAQVKIHYKLTVEGAEVDSSGDGEPLAFVVGSQQIIPGLEESLIGLHPGDKKSVTLPPEKAYGPVRAEAVQKVAKKNFKGVKDIKVGMTVTAQGNGNVIQAKVVEIGKETVSLDMNHPLAGKTLNFDVEVVSVEPQAAETTTGS